MRWLLIVCCCLFVSIAEAQDSLFITAYFHYGSKPRKEYRNTEVKWFGGRLGGHVGLGLSDDSIISFVPRGGFHYVAQKTDCRSAFIVDNKESFYSMFGTAATEVKKMGIRIPISASQKKMFDSLTTAYLAHTPYDYALFGMRCGAAAYDILARIGILKRYSYRATYLQVFYPRRLRKRLIRTARKYNWVIKTEQGTARRKWEKD